MIAASDWFLVYARQLQVLSAREIDELTIPIVVEKILTELARNEIGTGSHFLRKPLSTYKTYRTS